MAQRPACLLRNHLVQPASSVTLLLLDPFVDGVETYRSRIRPLMRLLGRSKKTKEKHTENQSPSPHSPEVRHSSPHARIQVIDDRSDLAVAQVVSALEATGLKYEPSAARRLLAGRFANGDPAKAVVLAFALRDAEDMIVVELSPSYLLGAENVRGTTCYLDALLFAMFSRSFPIFDTLLYHQGPDQRANRLAVNLRIFVNLLRSGYLVTHDLVDMLRKSIADCGWADAQSSAQQDTSECFGFIAEMLQMPMLTFKVHIAHAGREDVGADNKIVRERFLALSVPEPPRNATYLQPIELVDLIDAYFHTKLEVRRPVARSRSTMMSLPPVQTLPGNGASMMAVPKEKRGHEREVSMQAWQLFELVPYYSAADQSPRQLDFAQQPPVVAICLKRYYFDHNGTAHINKTPIIIPEFIDFTPFVDADNTMKRSGDLVRLRLESAVCHRGQHVGSGHYVSVSRGEVPNQWLLFDDLAGRRVTQGSFGQLFTVEVPYLLFYQLELIHPRRRVTRRQPSVPYFAPNNSGGGGGSNIPPYPIDSGLPASIDHGPPYPREPADGYFGTPPPVPTSTKPRLY